MTGAGRAVVLGLCLVAAVLGLIWGRQAAQPLSETEVIERWASDYVRRQGADAQRTDCLARPGPAGIWMVIVCTPTKAGAVPHVYQIGPDGERAVSESDVQQQGPRI